MADLVRMVRCPYTARDGKCGWVPMGRARTRCPRCGAEVKPEGSTDSYHVVVRREDGL